MTHQQTEGRMDTSTGCHRHPTAATVRVGGLASQAKGPGSSPGVRSQNEPPAQGAETAQPLWLTVLTPERTIATRKNTLRRRATNAELRERPPRQRRQGPYQTHTRRADGWVYFVQPVGGGPVRIGYAGNSVMARLGEWGRYCPFPLRLLAVVSGGNRCEYEIQRDLHDWRLHGEWFDPSAPLLRDLIASVDARLPAAEDKGQA